MGRRSRPRFNSDFKFLIQRAFPCIEFQAVVAMSKKVFVNIKVDALNLTNELIKGKGVTSQSHRPVSIREVGQCQL